MTAKFIFWGTDEFALGVLKELAELDLKPNLIVTAPDRARGRGLAPGTPPVKQWAETVGLPYHQPDDLRSDLGASLRSDLGLVASYGKIIPQAVLNLATRGFLNLHPSLLPKYRGASPIQSAILAGETETGISLMQMDEQMDHGPILDSEEYDLAGKTFTEARADLAKLGARLFAKNLTGWLEGKITPREQDHTQATFTKKIKKEDGLLDLNDQAKINYRKFLALNPWPGTYFFQNPTDPESRVIITGAELDRDGNFVITRVKPASRREMSWTDYQRGFAHQG